MQSARYALANWSKGLADVDGRALLLSEQFWRRAWIASFVLAVLVLLGVWHWWAAIVQAWPAAARIHRPG
ncbi:hypothetical protein AA18895_0943 [Acetobacter ghanensis DSM 18895]|nr:hypothetical protein AA18895_0943 [Acetobacter ghanensis DSM 18895]